MIVDNNNNSSDRTRLAELKKYLINNYRTPESYIIDKFSQYDVICVGEWHGIRHQVNFIKDIIPALYSNGIYYLALEFIENSKDQPLIDQVLNGKIYDEALARKLYFLNYVYWGYQEYVDILKSAWSLNQSLPDTKQKFSIIGLGLSPDWSHLKSRDDRNNPALMAKVWHGQDESLMANTVIKIVMTSGMKVLVYSGMHHSFTKFRQPIVSNGKFIKFSHPRMGNLIFEKIGEKAFTVSLHNPWYPEKGYEFPLVKPAEGMIDETISHIDLKYIPIGFDISGSPFAKIECKSSVYCHSNGDFNLGDFCDGYIFHKPFSEYEPVTAISNFINDANIDFAMAQSPDPLFRESSVEAFNNIIAKSTNITFRNI